MLGAKKYARILTIAGSDCGGGAGIQADIKTFAALGCYGMSVVTALTAQNTVGVKSIFPVSPEFIEDQLVAIFDDIGVDAIKIGMLHSAKIIDVVSKVLKKFSNVPLVVDPVMVAKGGAPLLDIVSINSLTNKILPFATILTPNIPETERLLEQSVLEAGGVEDAAKNLLKFVQAVVIKGGHVNDSKYSSDYLATRDGCNKWLVYPRVDTKNTHGTGCSFSAAIAAFLGLGLEVQEAVDAARQYLQAAIISGSKYHLGSGFGPIDHAVYQRSSK